MLCEVKEVDTCNKLLNSVSNIYGPVNGGDTALHVAIQNGDQICVDDLLLQYQNDFCKFRYYLESKYQWNQEDTIWHNKTILVAINLDQCRAVKDLEKNLLTADEIRQAIFILLQIPVEGEEVAIILPSWDNQLILFRLLTSLLPNGFLTWNYVGEGYRQTYMEQAASCGNIDSIQRLLSVGVELAIPDHSALLAACNTLQIDTIRWLLNEHLERVLRDTDQQQALLILLKKRNTAMFEFVLDKIIVYRRIRYKEHDSKALAKIIQYKFHPFVFKHLRMGPIRNKIEEFIIKYKLDLAYQWEGGSMLVCVMCRRLALNYCFDVIRQNYQLLGIITKNVSALHNLIVWGHFDFLKEMYDKYPVIKTYFQTDHGFIDLQNAILEKDYVAIEFILTHHIDYLRRDFDGFKQKVLCEERPDQALLEKLKLLINSFPNIETITDQSYSEQQSNENLEPGEESNTNVLLHVAIEKNNTEFFLQCLQNGWDIDALDSKGNHSIHYVRSLSMFDFLVGLHPKGINLVHRTNNDGYTLLHKVSSAEMDPEEKLQLLEKILARGADVNQVTKAGESAAFMTGNCMILELFMKYNIKLCTVNCKGETALLRYLLNRNASLVTMLLPLVYKSNWFNQHAPEYLNQLLNNDRISFSKDYQPMFVKYPDVLEQLLGAVYHHSREDASRLFAKACYGSLNFIVEKFLDFDFNLDYNCKTNYGCTPLIGLLSYAQERNVRLVERLLEKNVDVQIRDSFGRDALLSFALSFASVKQYGLGTGVFQVLLDRGASVNARDTDGNTALHFAFARNEWELLELLVRNGGDLRVRNNDDKLPYQLGPRINQELFSFMS
ncbi:uncharacterized protein LOC131437419 [Malaya genurostris]|uniref:uncharacterized protein LOC131437419 n=1 Tax=Malaya genurostris TaxID=325434 RepID=UPI0026F3DC9A|nr:uncharacterized protein LOC131437419 [Malaya genurostris]